MKISRKSKNSEETFNHIKGHEVIFRKTFYGQLLQYQWNLFHLYQT